MRQFVVAAAAAVCVLSASAGSAQSIAGTYDVEYPVRMMVNDNPSQAESLAKVKLVLEQKGDSVVGRWQMVSPRETPPEELRGTVVGNRVRLFGSAQAKLRGNGEEKTFSMTQELVFTVEGDEIKG